MMGNFLLPLLILIVLIIIGLMVWIVLTLSKSTARNKTAEDTAKSSQQVSAPSDSVLSVQKNQRGLWEVRVYNKSYKKLDDVPDPGVRDEVVDAIKIIAAFGRDYIAKEKASVPKPETTPAKQSIPAPSLTDVDRLRPPSTPPRLMPQIDLAREIGDILEEMQRQRPSMANRSIRLQNAPDGGVRFVIDGETYATVDEIPDLEVQALIRDATREWEKR